MGKIVDFLGGHGTKKESVSKNAHTAAFLKNYSIEVMPRTAAKVEDFTALLPAHTRVYVAHIDGTPLHEMLLTAQRLVSAGFEVMPHFPARLIASRSGFENWVRAYADMGIDQALVLGGGLGWPKGEFADSMQLLETGVFDAHGFKRLHIAGHPEGNKDIDPDGSDENVMMALRWKQAFNERTDAAMAIVTQFAFEPGPIVSWADRLKAEGVDLPIHIGIAGPAKLQTLIKFAVACGVGPSLRVLQRRATDMTKLLLPFEPTQIIDALAEEKAQRPDFGIENVHFFPLGGIKACATYANARAGFAGAVKTA